MGQGGRGEKGGGGINTVLFSRVHSCFIRACAQSQLSTRQSAEM